MTTLQNFLDFISNKTTMSTFVESLEESKCLLVDGVGDTDFQKPIAKRWKSSPPYGKVSRKIKEEIFWYALKT